MPRRAGRCRGRPRCGRGAAGGAARLDAARGGWDAGAMTQELQGADRGWLASPWPWLAYLPFYCLPWLWQRPSTAQLIAFALALLLFLPTYILSDRLRGARLMAASTLVLGIGIVLSQWGGSWTVFPIYAAAMAGAARNGGARLAVGDDGCGGSFREGFGLSGMRQRLTAAGGSLTLGTADPGTRLEAEQGGDRAEHE